MAKVQVKYLASLSLITGKRQEEIIAETVRDLLNYIFSKYGDRFKEQKFKDTESISSYYQIMVNKININSPSLKGLDTKLEDGYDVTIIPPVGGG